MISSSFKFRSIISSTVAISVLAISGSVFAENVTGAGASFPAPIFSKWADSYKKATGNKVNYQSVGSSAGIRQIKAKTVDFGSSDKPLKDNDLAEAGLVEFPSVIGGVVPVINIKGINSMVLDGETLAAIFQGKITKWNDEKIAKLNPGLKLPDSAIAVVRRSDGSGTTFLFTNYLSKVSSEWKDKIGSGSTVNWPVGLGGKGNEGVAAFVRRVADSIGYVEFAYAKISKLDFVKLINRDGEVSSPSVESFKAAAAGAEWDKTFYQVLTHQKGAKSWPITGANFFLMHKVQDNPKAALGAMTFFKWAYENGGEEALELDYVPLPESVVNKIYDLWKSQIKDKNGKVIFN